MFFNGILNRPVAINESGVGLKTFLGFPDASADFTGLKEDAKPKIQQLKGLIIRKPIHQKRGQIEDKISKLLVYGDQKMAGAK